ncbi:MAG: alpha/beta-type small acid-soluble spore protein [Clostridium sp.]
MNTNQTGKNSVLIAEARSGLDKFKEEVANELGMQNYAQMDKGNLTSRQNGYVGGTMVKRMVEAYENGLAGK